MKYNLIMEALKEVHGMKDDEEHIEEMASDEEEVAEAAEEELEEDEELEEAEEDLEEKAEGHGGKRLMNRAGSVVGGATLGSAAGQVAGSLGGALTSAAGGGDQMDMARAALTGMKLGGAAGGITGAVKGWRHATRTGKATYGESADPFAGMEDTGRDVVLESMLPIAALLEAAQEMYDAGDLTEEQMDAATALALKEAVALGVGIGVLTESMHKDELEEDEHEEMEEEADEELNEEERKANPAVALGVGAGAAHLAARSGLLGSGAKDLARGIESSVAKQAGKVAKKAASNPNVQKAVDAVSDMVKNKGGKIVPKGAEVVKVVKNT